MYFVNYGLWKTWLEKCQKSPVPEHRLTVNLPNVLRDSLNLHGSIFIIFSHHYGQNRVQKWLFYWYLKSWDCFFSTLTADGKHSLRIRENLSQPNQMQIFKKKNFFWKFSSITEIGIKFWTRWTSYPLHFQNYGPRKTWLDKCLRSPSFRIPFNSQHVKGSQRLLKSARQHFHHIFSSLWCKCSCKMPLVVIFEILGLLFNILTADNNYSHRTSAESRQPTQKQLSKKEKKIS